MFAVFVTVTVTVPELELVKSTVYLLTGSAEVTTQLAFGAVVVQDNAMRPVPCVVDRSIVVVHVRTRSNMSGLGFPNSTHIIVENGFHETLPAEQVQDIVVDFFSGLDVSGWKVVFERPQFLTSEQAKAQTSKPSGRE